MTGEVSVSFCTLSNVEVVGEVVDEASCDFAMGEKNVMIFGESVSSQNFLRFREAEDLLVVLLRVGVLSLAVCSFSCDATVSVAFVSWGSGVVASLSVETLSGAMGVKVHLVRAVSPLGFNLILSLGGQTCGRRIPSTT